MGVCVDAQINPNSEYSQGISNLQEAIWKYSRMPWLWFKPIFHLSGMAKVFHDNIAVTTGLTRRLITERKAALQTEAQTKGLKDIFDLQQNDTVSEENGATIGGKRKHAFLDLLLMMASENKLSNEDIREEVDTFMAEGDSDRDVTPEDLVQMKYLEQVIKEALRHFPPVPLFLRNVKKDVQIGNYTVPRGCVVLMTPFAVHRDSAHFGPKPLEFNPDHFLPENSAKRHPFGYVPFSGGPRNCIGQKFSLREQKTVLAWLMRKYTIKSLQTEDEAQPVPELVLRPLRGVKVVLQRREGL